MDSLRDILYSIFAMQYTEWGNDPEDDRYPMEFDVFDSNDERFAILGKALDELEELKAIPSSDQVCKALSEHIGKEIYYDDSNNTFYWKYGSYQNNITEVYENNNILILEKLTPQITTLVAKFYSSQATPEKSNGETE